MAFDLRPYQSIALDNLRSALARKTRLVLLYSPTGSGKTEMGMAMIRGAVGKGNASGSASGSASGMPAGMLNIKAPLDQQPQPKTKGPKPRANDVQPDFEADVEIAEAALGIGGAA